MNALPRLRTICGLAAFSLFMATVLTRKAFDDFASPFPPWMTTAEQWYDHALGAMVYLSVAVASMAYLRYRRRLARLGGVTLPRTWSDRHEVRAVLYLFAGVQLLQLPLAVYVTAKALHDPATPFAMSIYSAFPPEGVLGPLIGVAIIIYDRRRTTRERRRAANLCLTCGYDLRYTPVQCPECGARPALS